MNPDAPENLSEVQPALTTAHKSISATQMPETHLQTNYRTGAAAMFHMRSVLYLQPWLLPFVDYSKYNIYFQNAGLTEIIKESA